MLSFENIILLDKKKLAVGFFYAGMIVAYFGSLNPWFLWPLGSFYIVLACLFIFMSFMVDATMRNKIYTNAHFLIPVLVFAVLSYYQAVINNGTIKGLLAVVFHVIAFFGLFRVDKKLLGGLIDVLAKIMAVLLAVSIFFFVAYFIGVSLPSTNANYNDYFYTFDNYYFFLVADVPSPIFSMRFQSVFLEPGHLGVAAVLLLMTQCGKWKKWYNVVLLVATVMTFSLEAYVLLTMLFFFCLWIQRKHFIKKLFVVVLFLCSVVCAAFFYNDGNNLFHDLILLRLEIDDGELAGNNRVSSDFESDYSQFLESSDIMFGRDMEYDEFGNSGFSVFFYDNGLVGMLLLLVFYVVSMSRPLDRRVLVTAVTMAFLDFMVRAFPLWYSNFIPVYFMAVAYMPTITKNEEKHEVCLHP